MSLSVSVVVPPMTQLNTPYASLPVLSAYMAEIGHQVQAWDAALDLALSLYSAEGLARIFAAIDPQTVPEAYQEMYANAGRYQRVIDPLIHFLQAKDSGLAARIVGQSFVPQGPRFAGIDAAAEEAAFGFMGIQDHARWLATLCIQDLADLFRCTVSTHFGLTSYASSVAMSASSFDDIAAHLQDDCDPIEQELIRLCQQQDLAAQDLIILSIPFPGNLIAGLRIAQWCKQQRPDVRIVLGGGYANTELRGISDPRIFQYIDAICLDDGYVPLQAYCAWMEGAEKKLCNTFTCEDDTVVFHSHVAHSFVHSQLPNPDYQQLDMTRYLDLLDTWNPMQRLWNEGRWLKLVAAHGCYWKKCSFCDTSLPYIQDFQPQRASTLADRMDDLHRQTGLSGFHFTDEAAPPSLLLGLALELLHRGRAYHWWANIRFDSYFTPDRARVLAAAGLMAVSGGLEVAHDHHLKRINKGVSLEQASQVCFSLRSAGIMVHTYLMYGFPGQSVQDTVDSLEVVRQLFVNECIQSGFWHRFTCTAHSPVGRDPDAFQVRITGPEKQGFAWNNLEHRELHPVDHSQFDSGLAESLSLWQRGESLEEDLSSYFEQSVPKTQVDADFIEGIIEAFTTGETDYVQGTSLLWLGEEPIRTDDGLRCIDECGQFAEIEMVGEHAQYLCDILRTAMPLYAHTRSRLPAADVVADEDYEMLAEHGLLLI